MRDHLILMGAALVAFGGSLGSGFHFDDYAIFSDRVLTSAAGWTAVWSFTRARPLTDFTFWMNYSLGGRDPLGYHSVNLALHLGAVLLAFECLRRLLPERAALTAAAIFAIHPIQAEAVNYVWGRGIMLATALCLLALWTWLEGRCWAAIPWFAAALLAQPECAFFPVLLLITKPKKWAPFATLLALSLAALGRSAYLAETVYPSGRYLLAEGAVILRYLRLTLVPYGFTIDPDVSVPAVWIGLTIWIVLLGLAYLMWRRNWFWGLAAMVLLIPSSSIFPAPDLSADRRMYLPMLGLAAAAGLALTHLKPTSATPFAIGLVTVLAAVSVSRTVVWSDDQSLWREAVVRAPEKVRPRIQLARTLPAGQALEVLAAARRLAPLDPRVAAETGRVLLAQGQPEAALDEFSHAVAVDPGDALSWNNRGVAFEMLGQTAAAQAEFEHALRLNPGLVEARDNLTKITGAR